MTTKQERREKRRAAKKNKVLQHGRTYTEIIARMIVKRGKDAERKLQDSAKKSR